MNFPITCRFNSSSQLTKEKNRTTNEKIFSHVADWRIISSGVVKRCLDSSSIDSIEDQAVLSSSTSENDLLEQSLWTETLRQPMTHQKAKKIIDGDNDETKMTRNCEHLFFQMKSSYSVAKPKKDIDPSYSVRRIVKGSGLLGAFGPGVSKTDNVNTHKEQINSNTTSHFGLNKHEKQPFDVNAFVHSTQIPELRENANCAYIPFEKLPSRLTKPIQTYDSLSGPSSFKYDTVLMQKTIETEVVEYLPYDDDSDDTSPPQKRYMPEKKMDLFTPASDDFTVVGEQNAQYRKPSMLKKQFLLNSRHCYGSPENKSDSSDFEY